MPDLKPFIAKTANGFALSAPEAEDAFDIIMSGEASPAQIAGLLMTLRVRGETIEEITGAVRAMRNKMLPIKAPAGAIDVCGTGGDGGGTLNISTAVAFVIAACNVPVAKHGNRAASSKSGAADILAALGVNIEADFPLLEKALSEIGTAFLWAQRHHSAMRHVGPTRAELGTRTIFNIMGPLSNPAGVKRQLTGVFDKKWLDPMAHVLHDLGSERAWLVHGEDGLDEITITGKTFICELDQGKIHSWILDPLELGLKKAKLEDIRGGDAASNAEELLYLLKGKKSPYRDIVLLNAAAGLVIAGKCAHLADGISLTAQAIDSGSALDKLHQLIEITHTPLIETEGSHS